MSDTLLGPGYDQWKTSGPPTDRLAEAQGDWSFNNDDDLEALHSLVQRAADVLKRALDPKADVLSYDDLKIMDEFCDTVPHYKDIFENYPMGGDE